jgi:hypothetical protein
MFLKFKAEEESLHMQSPYGIRSQEATPALEYVGVGRRVLALLIDGIILLIIGWIIAVVLPSNGVMNAGGDAWDRFKHLGPGAIVQMIIPFVYYIVLEAMQGATFGKMVLVVGELIVLMGSKALSGNDVRIGLAFISFVTDTVCL